MSSQPSRTYTGDRCDIKIDGDRSQIYVKGTYEPIVSGIYIYIYICIYIYIYIYVEKLFTLSCIGYLHKKKTFCTTYFELSQQIHLIQVKYLHNFISGTGDQTPCLEQADDLSKRGRVWRRILGCFDRITDFFQNCRKREQLGTVTADEFSVGSFETPGPTPTPRAPKQVHFQERRGSRPASVFLEELKDAQRKRVGREPQILKSENRARKISSKSYRAAQSSWAELTGARER